MADSYEADDESHSNTSFDYVNINQQLDDIDIFSEMNEPSLKSN